MMFLQSPSLLRLLLYPGNVLLGDDVPGLHVLLHARGEAGFFAFGKRGSGFGDAALEAVLVEFLVLQSALYKGKVDGQWAEIHTSTNIRAFCIAASC
jgi:hypothetical protein